MKFRPKDRAGLMVTEHTPLRRQPPAKAMGAPQSVHVSSARTAARLVRRPLDNGPLTRSRASAGEHLAQPSEQTWLFLDKHCADVARGRRCADGCTEMAVADDLMQLLVAQLEETPGFTVAVILHSGGPEDRVLEGNGDRRTITAHGRADSRWLILCLVQCREASVRVTLKELRPTLKALLAR